MTKASTRNRIVWQAEKACRHADSIMQNLFLIEQFSNGRNEFVNKNIGDVCRFVSQLQEILSEFRTHL